MQGNIARYWPEEWINWYNSRVLFPKTCDPQNRDWIAKTMGFMEANFHGSGLGVATLEKLWVLHIDDRILFKNLGPVGWSGYNHLTRRLTINADALGFVQRDFARQIEVMQTRNEPNRVALLRRMHQECLIELSGLLVHEGQHAIKYYWSRAKDETMAFRAEQRWYAHLYSLKSEHTAFLIQLAKSTEDDSQNALAYRRLCIDAPALIP